MGLASFYISGAQKSQGATRIEKVEEVFWNANFKVNLPI